LRPEYSTWEFTIAGLRFACPPADLRFNPFGFPGFPVYNPALLFPVIQGQCFVRQSTLCQNEEKALTNHFLFPDVYQRHP
jgi:hypothetical protein